MNSVILIGRLTKDPEVRYTSDQLAIASFNLAIDRPGKDKGTDFPSVKCFGKTAELAERYLMKGRQVAVTGRIQTGNYEKDGRKYYTTEVVASGIEFLGSKDPYKEAREIAENTPLPEEQLAGFEAVDDDIPF